jgi:hypothetical protein|tara:strand:+ start:1723 stop:2535 length:813 start_codon:yes stop_codon:yes gene_type:complete
MISQIHTTCKDCAFAVYSGKRQTECSAGILDRYRNNGAEIIDVYDDNGKEFFVINNKLCSHHREKEWAKKYSKSELLNIVNSQTKSPYQAMILYCEESTPETIGFTLKSLAEQFNPPNIISIIVRKATDSIYKLNMEIEAVVKKYDNKFDWRIQNILDTEETSVRQSIDLAVDGTYFKYSFPYYLVFESGFEVPKDFTEELHNSIMFEGKQMIFCHPVKGSLNGMLVNRLLHRKHTGNAFNINIEDKIAEFEENAKDYMFPIDEICPSIK